MCTNSLFVSDKRAEKSSSFISKHLVFLGECIEVMKSLESDSDDMILADPPYNTANKNFNKTKEFFDRADNLLENLLTYLEQNNSNLAS